MSEFNYSTKKDLINQICSSSGASGEALAKMRARLEKMDEAALQNLLASNEKDLSIGVTIEKAAPSSAEADSNIETFTETRADGKNIEVILTLDEENRPIKRVEKFNGNTISTTTYTWHAEDENTIQYVTLSKELPDKSKVITTALEADAKGNVEAEDFIDRTTILPDGTETAIYIKDGAIVEQKVKPNGKKVLTAYNGTDINAYDKKDLHRLFQQTEKDGIVNISLQIK